MSGRKYRGGGGSFVTTETGYNALMNIVCVGWGFCGCIKDGKPLHVDNFIPNAGEVTADQFVEWVFLADDVDTTIDPNRWQKHKNSIRKAFIECMGSDVVEADKLDWDYTEKR